LPRRVRQANLSPHLRSRPSSGTSAGLPEPETRSPEQAQSLLAWVYFTNGVSGMVG
jgi:hypothetical protein